MENEEINIAIAKHLGVKPRLLEWVACKDDSICMSAPFKKDVEKWLAELPEGSWAKDYTPKPLYAYPDYCTDANATHDIIDSFTRKQTISYISNLYDIVGGTMDDAVVARRKDKALAILKTLQEE